jgi:hypothetical protein
LYTAAHIALRPCLACRKDRTDSEMTPAVGWKWQTGRKRASYLLLRVGTWTREKWMDSVRAEVAQVPSTYVTWDGSWMNCLHVAAMGKCSHL